jgi:hypothetical protein
MSHIYTAALDGLAAALRAKGFHSPGADLILRDSEGYAAFSLEVDYKVRPDSMTTYLHMRSYDLEDGASVEAAVAAMHRKIDEMPSQREQEIKAFINQMEALKSSAEDLGIEADFVNPLLAIMQKLASNALPAPKG